MAEQTAGPAGAEQFNVVALGEAKGKFHIVALNEIPHHHPLPGDVIEVVDAAGRRGVARIQCTNWMNKTAHVVPVFFQDEP
jgi:hypothetical protein